MADKYLYIDTSDGRTKVREGTVTSTGAPEAGDIVALDAAGKLDPTVFPTGFGADMSAIVAGEDLSAGDFIYCWNNGGTPTVSKADASAAGKEAQGFVLAATLTGGNADVYWEGVNNQLSGLTVGARYYLSGVTAGDITATPPATASYVVQYVGRAIATTELSFEPAEGVVLA